MFDINSFKESLENVHKFPCEYCFKFVANNENIETLREVLKKEKYEEKKSSKGNFTAITLRKKVKNSDDVINIYLKVSEIDGIMTL